MPDMNHKLSLVRLVLTGGALIVATAMGQAQIAATLSDIGAANPVPGPNDPSQLLCRTGTGNPPGLNYYWDNGSPNGSTFSTGSNPGGYVLNSVALKSNGGGGSDGSGGISVSQPYWLRIYAISGPGTSASATLLAFFQSQSFGFTGADGGAEGDWLQMGGLNLPLAPNTIYAYTFSRSTGGYENLGNVGGDPYPGAIACEIPAAGGTVDFTSNTNYVGTFDIGLNLPVSLTVAPPTVSPANPIVKGTTVTLKAGTVVDNAGNGTYTYQWQTDGDGNGGTLTNIPGATASTLLVNTTGLNLGGYQYQVVVRDSASQTVVSTPAVLDVMQILSGTFTDAGTNPPVPGNSDVSQLTTPGYQVATGLNYYDDNSTPPGQSFTTGGNAKGYSLTSLAVDIAGGNSAQTTTPQGYDLYIFQISADGSTATLMADITNLDGAFNYGDWVQWNFPAIVLNSNSVYAYAFHRDTTGYAGLATSAGGDVYPGGQMALIPAAGGPVTYASVGGLDGTFDIGLIPNGAPFLLTPVTAAPNPVYALSPVSLACKPTTAGIYTYQWMSDDGTGIHLAAVPGATSTNLTVVPPDLNPGGADYTTNYYFVATDATSGNSVTSSVAVLTIHPASLPQFSTLPNPTNLVTFAGNSVIYSVAEFGTLPITNQWQLSTGGGFVSLTGKTNTTLTLNNVQPAASGSYQLVATNRVGNTNVAVTLTVLAAPAAPVAASQRSFNMIYTNHPWAYWRLNETNDPTAPGAPTYMAYDYSGNNFDAAYGDFVTVSNVGPRSPTYPGFDAGELAAGTTTFAGAALTVPALNLAGNSNLTFMAWINPNGGQFPSAGLLFNRGGPDNACGFGFGDISDHLGYTWNNNSANTYNWDSGLVVADNQWNFVAYVITPTNATVYLGNLNGGTNFLQANNPIVHASESFAGGTILLGGDPFGAGRYFTGLITEAALFTNALSTLQVQQYFETAIGASSLPPTVAATVLAPASGIVYSGQNVRMTASVSGTAPLSLQWQASSDESTWVNVVGGTANTLLINPFIVGTLYYQLVAVNPAGKTTNSPVAVTFNPLPSYPAGLWTVNFQETNNIGANQTAGGGVGHYVGRGVLGSGTYWNVLPHILPLGGEYGANNLVSVSDLRDDGATHTGIYCHLNSGGSYDSLGLTLTYSSDIGNLLDQFYRTYYSSAVDGTGALQFFGVPAGTYNLVCYSGNGVASSGADNYGSTFVVYDPVNGNQTNSASDTSPGTDALVEGVNFVTFTNVHIGGGELNVDVLANPATGASAVIEAAQLQLVSYDNPLTNLVAVAGQFASANHSLTLTWPQGVLQTATNLQGPWTSIYLPSPVTITATNGTQFFRTQVHP